MTVVLKNAFPNRVDISDPNYPWGKGINQQEGVVDSGTPIDATWFNDVEGGKQGLLRLAGIVPSGVPDNVSNSDVTKAIKIISKFQSVGNVVGSFRYGCTVASSEDIVIDNNGVGWKYVGAEVFPFDVVAESVPDGDWEIFNLDTFYIRTVTLSEAIVEDAPVGTRYYLTDFSNAPYEVVDSGDLGGFYIEGLTSGRKLKLINKGAFHILEHYGVKSSNTPEENAALFIASIKHQNAALTANPYIYDFANESLETITGEYLLINTGKQQCTIKNFKGIESNTVKNVYVDVDFTGAGDGLETFLKMNVLEKLSSEFFNIDNISTNLDTSAFFIRFGEGADVQASLDFKIAKITNIITNTTAPSGANQGAPATTIFGNFGSSSTFSKVHTLNFGTLIVDEFYTLNGSTIIDGESDVFRLFRNPTNVNIDNLVANNFAKRLLKSQDICNVNIGVFRSYLDSRFNGSSNHIATFDFQVVNQLEPSSLRIELVDVDYSEVGGNTPVLATGSSLNHQFNIDGGKTKNVSIYSDTDDVYVNLSSIITDATFINCQGSSNVTLDDIDELTSITIFAEDCYVSNSTLRTSSGSNTSPRINNATLENVIFEDWDIGKVATLYKSMRNVTVNAVLATTTNRIFAPANDDSVADNITFNNNTGSSAIAMSRASGSGTVKVKDFKVGGTDSVQLGFFGVGTWDFILDNCENETLTGAGVNSKVKATYTAF